MSTERERKGERENERERKRGEGAPISCKDKGGAPQQPHERMMKRQKERVRGEGGERGTVGTEEKRQRERRKRGKREREERERGREERGRREKTGMLHEVKPVKKRIPDSNHTA